MLRSVLAAEEDGSMEKHAAFPTQRKIPNVNQNFNRLSKIKNS
jgi:hypothetical protein